MRPVFNPLHGGLKGFPPVYMVSGIPDFYYSDTPHLAYHLCLEDIDFEIYNAEGLFHDWWLYSTWRRLLSVCPSVTTQFAHAGNAYGTAVAVKLPCDAVEVSRLESLGDELESLGDELQFLRHLHHPSIVLSHGVNLMAHIMALGAALIILGAGQQPRPRAEPEDGDEQIFVKTLNGKTIAVPCKASEPVGRLKARIWSRTWVPVRCQRLVHAGKELLDDAALADQGIMRGQTCELMLCLHGGMRGPRDERRAHVATDKPRGRRVPREPPAEQAIYKPESDDEQQSRSVFVGGIPASWQSFQLERVARRFGNILQAVVFFGEDQRPMRAGKVTYHSREQAAEAIKGLCDMKIEGGQVLRANYWAGTERRRTLVAQRDEFDLAKRGEMLARQTLAAMRHAVENMQVTDMQKLSDELAMVGTVLKAPDVARHLEHVARDAFQTSDEGRCRILLDLIEQAFHELDDAEARQLAIREGRARAAAEHAEAARQQTDQSLEKRRETIERQIRFEVRHEMQEKVKALTEEQDLHRRVRGEDAATISRLQGELSTLRSRLKAAERVPKVHPECIAISLADCLSDEAGAMGEASTTDAPTDAASMGETASELQSVILPCADGATDTDANDNSESHDAESAQKAAEVCADAGDVRGALSYVPQPIQADSALEAPAVPHHRACSAHPTAKTTASALSEQGNGYAPGT